MSDLSQSIIAAINAQVPEDQRGALLEQFSEPSNSETMLDDLCQQFTLLGRETIKEELKNHGWNVENVFVPLLNKMCEIENKLKEEQRKKQEIETIAAKERAKQAGNALLQDLFAAVPPAQIQKILDDNDGDVAAAMDQLSLFVKEEEVEKQKREKRTSVNVLCGRFPIDEKKAEQVLEKNKWSVEGAVLELIKTTTHQKVIMFMRSYPQIQQKIIEQVLEMNEYDTTSTTEALNNLVKNNNHRVETSVKKPDLVASIMKEVADEVASHDPKEALREKLENTLRLNNSPGIFEIEPLVDDLPKKLAPVEERDVQEEKPKENPVVESQNQIAYDQPKPPVTIVSDSKRYEYGKPIVVKWTSTGVPKSGDWIGIYPVAADDKSYLTYQWVTTDQSGSVNFTAPSNPGLFQFRYFHSKTYERACVSETVRVGPEFKLSASIVGERMVKIESVQITPPVCPNAWVAVYEPGKENNAYYDYQWRASGELVFKLPKVGNWEFRIFPDKSYYEAASCTINIQGDDKITLSVENNQLIINYKLLTLNPQIDNAWIGIYRVDEQNNYQWRRYKKVFTNDGEIRVKALQTSGTYEARLFAHKSMVPLSKSVNTVTTQ